METEKYWKYHLSRAWTGTKKELNKHRYIEIGIAVGGSIFIVIKYLFFDSMLKQTIIEFSGLIGTLFIAFMAILFINRHKASEYIFAEGQKALSSLKEEVKFLKEQQKPKLEIRFDEDDPRYIDDTSKWTENAQTGERTCLEISHVYRIAVHNSSETTIENVQVQLDKINLIVYPSERKEPRYESKLPIHFKFTNDKEPYDKSTEINPGDDKFVDIVACFMKSVRIKNNHFIFQCIEDVYPYLIFDIDEDSFEITIKITGRNVTCKPRKFMIDLKYGNLLMHRVD